jgi:MYXO-CTERM domain-containing protein
MPLVWPVEGRPATWRRGQLADGRPAGVVPPERHHAGADLTAKPTDWLVATEPGKLYRSQGWDGAEAKALVVHTDSGRTLIYGNVAPGSWLEAGVDAGARLVAGQRLGRPGRYPRGNTNLHFEVYAGHLATNLRWWWGTTKPTALLDPDAYLEHVGASAPTLPSPVVEPVADSSGGGAVPLLVLAVLVAAARRR